MLTLPPLRPIRSQMSLKDLWDMNDHKLWTRGIYRYWHVVRCLCGKEHHWYGRPYGGWTDQDGVVVMCVSPVNV